MTNLAARSRLPRAAVGIGLRRPRAVLLVWVAISITATAGVSRLAIETSTDSVLDRASSDWHYYQASQERFGGDEILTILLESEMPFEREVLAEVVRLTRRFESEPGVWRVDSLATVPLVHAAPDGAVSLEAALESGLPGSANEARRLESRVRADRLAPRNLVSDDGRAFAVNLVLEQGAESRYSAILAAIDEELKGRRALVSGVPVFRTAADSRNRSELLLFIPATVITVGVLLYLVFGSLGAVLIPLAASGLGTWVVLGAMGAVGTPLTISTVVLPSILLALGCAYTMHLLTAAVGKGAGEALSESLLAVSLPVAVSGLTTAVGFTAVSFVRIETIRDLGGFGALGVVVILAATLTVVPSALRLWPLPEKRQGLHRWFRETGAARIVEFAEARQSLILVAWVVAAAVISVGVARIHVETDVVLWFSKNDPIRMAYEEIREKLSGISPMNVVIEAPEGQSVSAPDVLKQIDGLTAHLESLPDVGRAISITDALRQLHGGFIDDPGRPLPGSSNLVSQYLLLLDAKDYTDDLIAEDRSAANVRLRIDNNGSKALLAVAETADSWWAEHGVPGYEARATGIMYEFGRSEDAIARGQLQGLGFALAVIGLLLLAIFRWARLALVALIPNVIPVVMAFGLMGLLGVPLDAGTVVLGNLALGIAVDDTIHLVTGFYEGREGGEEPHRALVGAFERALAPLVYTTLAVALGFAVLGVSGFTLTRHLGLLTAGIMLLCLLADVLLLPVLLLRLRRREGGDEAAEFGSIGAPPGSVNAA